MRNAVEKKYIEMRIADVSYTVLPGTTCTICNITMVNGFGVRGESACVDPKNFDAAVGRKIAYENAFDKLWQLEGYLLAEERWLESEWGKVDEAMRINTSREDLITEDMNFGQALEALKAGMKVARAGWNGKGMWISLSGRLEGYSVPAERFWSEHNAAFARSQPYGEAVVLPCITMKTADGKILMGWLTSQTDMLADDWMIVA